MRAHLWPVLFVAACRYSEPQLGDQAGGDGSVPIDAPPDVSFDGPAHCYGTGLDMNACLADPTMPLTLMGGMILLDTDRSPLCVPANPTTFCVVAGTDVTIDTHLVAFGSRPLVIISTSALSVKGAAVVDVSSNFNDRGPGSDAKSCIVGSDPDPDRGGGGRGGSFGTAGGNGGNGHQNGDGGIASAATLANAFRGGCAGSDGGGGGNRGAAGHGGGAVYLFASAAIHIDGTINASGGAGFGAGTGQDGGGGGGSGGLIAFESPALTFAGGANIYANGGGGGEGSAFAVGGKDGKAPTSPDTAAAGGGDTANSNAGTGGAGSVGSTAGLPGSNGGFDVMSQYGLDGGGGGGGGGGVIFVFGAVKPISGHVSPPIQ